MRNDVLVDKALDVAKSFKTVYANGFIGSPLTNDNIASKAKQLPNWYTAERIAKLKSLVGKGYFGFDCVCFVKSLLWGWSGNASATYGGAKYESNGVPDIGENEMMNRCKNVSTDFKNILPGEFLWINGHCGIYVGNGQAVECTTKWDSCVQITAVENIGKKSGYNSRTWTKHGQLPYVEYQQQTAAAAQPTSAQPTASGKEVSISLLTLRKGENRLNPQIYTAQRLLKALGYYTIAIDGAFGPGMETAVMNFQRAKKLPADGVIGKDTWTALLK